MLWVIWVVRGVSPRRPNEVSVVAEHIETSTVSMVDGL